MLLRPLFFTSFLIDDQLADEGLTERGPDRDLQRLEQDRDRRRLPAGAARRGRAGRPHLGRQQRVRRGPRHLRPHRQPTTRSTRSSAGPPPTSTSPATAPCARRSTPTSATSWSTAWRSGSPTGRSSAPARETCPGPPPTFFFAPTRVEKRSADWGPAELERRVAEAWHPFCEWTAGWLETIPGQGFDGAPERLPRRARGPSRPQERPRDLALTRPAASLLKPRLLRCARGANLAQRCLRKEWAILLPSCT